MDISGNRKVDNQMPAVFGIQTKYSKHSVNGPSVTGIIQLMDF